MCYLIQHILIRILSMKHCSLEKTYIDHKYIDGNSRSVLGEFWSGTTPPPLPPVCKTCVRGILHFTDERSRGTSFLVKVRQQINYRAEILFQATLIPNGDSYSQHFQVL